MKLRNICLLLFSLVGMSSFAQLNGDGYYRVQNCYPTGRYIYVMDDYGKINTMQGSADMQALSLRGGTFDTHLYNPATVLYIKNIKDDSYNLASQGTNVYKIISHYLTLKSLTYEGKTVYMCSASSHGVTLYLMDPMISSVSRYPMVNVSTQSGPQSPTQRYWFIRPIDSDSDEDYFGIKPETEAIDGKYYRSFYAAFPFKLKSSGMKAFYINKIDGDNAEMVEFASDATIPASTPVIIECSSDDPSNNRIDIINGSVSAISDNVLTGVYFKHDNDEIEGLRNYYDLLLPDTHIKHTAYVSSTMRILGKKADGTLGFVTSSTLDYIPANSAYLPVASGSASELNIVKSTSGIQSITVDEQASKQGVYTLQGVKVADDASATDKLSKGVYIVSGKKVLVK